MQNLNVSVKIQKAFAIVGVCNARRFKQIIVTTTKDKLHLGIVNTQKSKIKLKQRKYFAECLRVCERQCNFAP